MCGSDWVVIWRVVREFFNLAPHRFSVPMKVADLADYIGPVLWPRCAVLPSVNIYRAAASLHARTKCRFYDSRIVAAALACEASILYTEDIQDGRLIGSLKIQSPFH